MVVQSVKQFVGNPMSPVGMFKLAVVLLFTALVVLGAAVIFTGLIPALVPMSVIAVVAFFGMMFLGAVWAWLVDLVSNEPR